LKLVSQDTPVNFWRQTGVDLKTAVPPGSTASFWVPIEAPGTPGTYPFQREMKDFNAGGVGDFRVTQHCVNLSIAVNEVPPLAASVASQSFPLQMAPSETRAVTVRMTNTGTRDWTTNGSYVLNSINTPVNLWGKTVEKVAVATPVGSTADFTLFVTAPPTPGTYRQRWQMRKVDGTDADFFGEIIDVAVTVDAGLMPQYGARLVSQTIPTSMSAGQSYPISVTLQNAGSATWSGGAVFLSSTNSPANLWGTTVVPLAASETIAPGASRTFDFTVRAPSAPGTYAFSWRMSSNAVGRFGDAVTSTLFVGSASCNLDAFPRGTYELDIVTTTCSHRWSEGIWRCGQPTTVTGTLTMTPIRYLSDPSCPQDPACFVEDPNNFEVVFDAVGYVPFGPASFISYVPDTTVSIHVSESHHCSGWPEFCGPVDDSIDFYIGRATGAVTAFRYASWRTSLGPDGTDTQTTMTGSGSLVCSAASAAAPMALK
jgi:hypothetical protein